MKLVGWKDYLDEVYKEFDKVDEASIRAVIKHGLQGISNIRRCGLDIMIKNDVNQLYYYIGNKPRPMVLRNLRKKIRYMYLMKKVEYDGTMYFSLNEKDYQLYLTGVYPPLVTFYKVQRECETYWDRGRQFKIAYADGSKFLNKVENPDLSNAEYIKETKAIYETTSE